MGAQELQAVEYVAECVFYNFKRLLKAWRVAAATLQCQCILFVVHACMHVLHACRVVSLIVIVADSQS